MSGTHTGQARWRVRSSYLALVAVGLFSLVGVLLWRSLTGKETLLQAAQNVHRAFREADGKTMFKYMSTFERRASNVTEHEMTRLMTEFVQRRMAGFQPVGELKVTPYPEGGSLAATQSYQHADG